MLKTLLQHGCCYLVRYLRVIDLVSFFHWHPKWPSEIRVPKLDLQIKGFGFHLAYLLCGKAVKSLMSSLQQGIRNSKSNPFVNMNHFLFQVNQLMSILILLLPKWRKPWRWIEIQSELGDLNRAMLLQNSGTQRASDTAQSSMMGRSARQAHIDF